MEIIKLKDNTFSIVVPKGVRYLSNWKEFEILPFPHILDKQIPGCGFTEFCLTNDQDLVLCSPRKLLLENKFDQHKDEIFYVQNSYEVPTWIDKDLTKQHRFYEPKKPDKTPEEIRQEKLEYYNKLKGEIENYILNRKSKNLPFKIIVTYDSFYLVKGILKEIPITLSDFIHNKIQYVVDEFQSIFTDATFKSSTENDFLIVLTGLKKVCYISATPMIEGYLRLIDTFKDLPYYELDWCVDDKLRVKKPELEVRLSRSVTYTAKEIINSYLNKNFKTKFIKRDDGSVELVESKEAVFYLNSVNNILTIVKKMKLTKDQVNILCADTPENQKKIKKKLGARSKITIGKIPLKGEPHKMFTFCTRTVYLGADFYSTNARSFILSDANIETLAVDISLDLPQILGRQRLRENPWKDEAEFFYKPICKSGVFKKEDFDKILKIKYDRTGKLLLAFDQIQSSDLKFEVAVKYERDTITSNYKSDYVAINNLMANPGTFIKKPILNKLVMIAEQRAFDIQQIDYRDRFSVFSAIEENELKFDYQETVLRFFEGFEQLKTLGQKLKYFCEFPCDDDTKKFIQNQITEKHFNEYLDTLGPEQIKAEGYNITGINKRLGIISFNKLGLITKIRETFEVGGKYSRLNIKNSLRDIYTECGYEKSPVASDLDNYFNLKVIKVKDNTGKFVSGYEILSSK
jgi:hypothetical protein